MKQHESTYWDLVREGRYRRLCATSASTEAEYNRQMTRVQTLLSIVEKLEIDFPQVSKCPLENDFHMNYGDSFKIQHRLAFFLLTPQKVWFIGFSSLSSMFTWNIFFIYRGNIFIVGDSPCRVGAQTFSFSTVSDSLIVRLPMRTNAKIHFISARNP